MILPTRHASVNPDIDTRCLTLKSKAFTILVIMTVNIHAQALGRLGKGHKKTLSPAALDQRRNAARKNKADPDNRMHNGKLVSRQYINQLRFPERSKARHKALYALKKGKIKTEPCFCGAKGQMHHDDYSKPLEIIWLCKHHHAERDKALRTKALSMPK